MVVYPHNLMEYKVRKAPKQELQCSDTRRAFHVFFRRQYLKYRPQAKEELQ